MTDFTSEEELEQYIRSKYSEYFKEEPPSRTTHHHTSSLDKQLFEKKVCFTLP
jgi:hypothetical protein